MSRCSTAKRIDKSLVAITNVHLKAHSREMMLAFEREVIGFTEVMECFDMTGEYDFLLKVAVRDMEEYTTSSLTDWRNCRTSRYKAFSC